LILKNDLKIEDIELLPCLLKDCHDWTV